MSHNLDELLNVDTAHKIDPKRVDEILSSPPFIQVDGLFNLRDISDGTQSELRRSYCFRSGALENLTEAGKASLQRLGIRTIFDLRSAREASAHPDPYIDGITAVEARTETDPLRATKFNSLVEMYMELLETHRGVWKEILTHIRDFPDRPVLFHCTGGKDRTGLAACLIHSVAGVPKSYITREYALTRIGIEPVREFLLQKLGAQPPDFDLDPKIMVFMRIDPPVMETFLSEVETKFGGVQKYIIQQLGFDEKDLEIMRRNLRGSN